MQTAKLPVTTCNAIDKLNKGFLWGDSENKKKVHLARWDLVCQPKSLGGLGIKKTVKMNQALLAKASWRMTQKEDGLWCRVLEQKYLKNDSIWNTEYPCPAGCSSTWRGIVFGAKLLHQGIQWRIGDGDSVHFWKDKWLSSGPLIDKARNVSLIDTQLKVRDFLINDDWNLRMLHDIVDNETVANIVKTPAAVYGSGNDKIIWNGTSNGKFSIASAYSILFNNHGCADSSWNFIWKLPTPPKLKIFSWLLYNGKLLTNMERRKRSLTCDDTCPICKQKQESTLHLLRDCPKAMLIWKNVICTDSIARALALDWNG